MPRKIKRDTSKQIVPAGMPPVAGGEIGGIMIGAGMITQAYASVVVAQTQLITETVKSVAECFKDYCNYMAECQKTRQVEIWSATVLAEARERTHQIEIQAQAFVLEAREQTRRVEIQAEITRDQLGNVREARQAKMEIVHAFLGEHHRLHEILIHQSSSGIQNLAIEERVHLTKRRDEVLQRLRELESAITSMASAL